VKRNLKKAFGQVIKELRKEKSMSQKKLADLAEMDRSYLADLERGLNYPSLNVVYKLAEVLEMEAHELIEIVDERMKS
jgi:transcriptional regulator with XRE-family HTH domain